MKRIDRHHFDMLARVKQFGVTYAELFPPDSLGARSFAALGAALDQASGSVTSDVQGRTATRKGTLSKADAREALRAKLEGLARTARAIVPDVPAVKGSFRLVTAGKNDLELLAAARSFILDATPLAERFIAHGLRPTFLADLQSAVETFEAAARDRVAARQARASAGAGITQALDAADEALARLDAIVPNIIQERPTVLAAWTVARRVQRNGARGPGQATPAPNESGATEPTNPIPQAAPRMTQVPLA